MAYPWLILEVLGCYNPPYDPLDKHLSLSGPVHEFHRGTCLKIAYGAHSEGLCSYSFIHRCVKFLDFIAKKTYTDNIHYIG